MTGTVCIVLVRLVGMESVILLVTVALYLTRRQCWSRVLRLTRPCRSWTQKTMPWPHVLAALENKAH